MTRLILVRHGNTFEKSETARFIGARTDLPLTEKGKKQAETAADYLRKENFIPTVIFHGPLRRQSETARIISARLRVANVVENADLSEIDYGPWENLSSEEIKFMWPEEFRHWESDGVWPDTVFPVREASLKESLKSWIERVGRDYAGQTVLAVSSNGILRTLKKIVEKNCFNFKESKVRTGAVCAIELTDTGPEIKFWDLLP